MFSKVLLVLETEQRTARTTVSVVELKSSQYLTFQSKSSAQYNLAWQKSGGGGMAPKTSLFCWPCTYENHAHAK